MHNSRERINVRPQHDPETSLITYIGKVTSSIIRTAIKHHLDLTMRSDL